MAETKKGVLGGTFNPIHNGHLALAEFCRKTLSLDLVYFVTAANPPHKPVAHNIGENRRHDMVEAALQPYDHLVPLDIELKREGPSYTVNTLKELSRTQPESDLFFIIGGDTIADLPAWYKLPAILQLAELVTVNRPGCPERYRAEHFPQLTAAQVERLNRFVLHMAPHPESSTEIRNRIREGKSIEGMVPDPVLRYIRKHHLYQSS